MTQQQEIAKLLRELAVQLDAIANQIESSKADTRVNLQVGSVLKQVNLLRLAEQKLVEAKFAKAHSLVLRVRHYLSDKSEKVAG